jgi:hypothetical protein
MGHLALEGQILQGPVGRDERERPGHLIELARLDPDPAVLDHVHPPETVPAAERVHGSDQVRERPEVAVEHHGNASLESDGDLGGFGGPLRHGGGPGKRILGWRHPRILERAAFGGPPP